jgi:DNA segregation ATPase FtsK/SpoIIIE-like protein
MRAEAAMQGIAAALQGDETPDAARRSGDITGACAQGNDVGPASRPDGAAQTLGGDHAEADENTAPGTPDTLPGATPVPPKATDGDQATDGPNAVAQPAGVDRDLLDKAVALIKREQKATVRMLKTELSIGTTKALQLMAWLEQKGHVSPTDERGARKVLVAA